MPFYGEAVYPTRLTAVHKGITLATGISACERCCSQATQTPSRAREAEQHMAQAYTDAEILTRCYRITSLSREALYISSCK